MGRRKDGRWIIHREYLHYYSTLILCNFAHCSLLDGSGFLSLSIFALHRYQVRNVHLYVNMLSLRHSRVSNCLKLTYVCTLSRRVYLCLWWHCVFRLFSFCVCWFVMLLLFSSSLCSRDSSMKKKIKKKKKWWCRNFGLNRWGIHMHTNNVTAWQNFRFGVRKMRRKKNIMWCYRAPRVTRAGDTLQSMRAKQQRTHKHTNH